MVKKDFRIDDKIYPKDLIEKWLKVFKDNFSLTYDKWNLVINEEKNQELVFLEFVNYLTYLSVSND
jgi:hypothetical protein